MRQGGKEIHGSRQGEKKCLSFSPTFSAKKVYSLSKGNGGEATMYHETTNEVRWGPRITPKGTASSDPSCPIS